MSNLAKKLYNIHHLLKIFSIPVAIILIGGLSILLFTESEKPISSSLIASFIFISYYLITYLFICPYLFNRDSIITLFLVVIFLAILAGILFMVMLKFNILAYPKPYDTHPTNDTYILSIVLVCSIAVLLGATNTYLILNTFQISADSYNLLQKSYQSEINALRLQMNPHYISNSLNNLNHIIRKGDLNDAIQYNDELIELLEEQMRYINSETISLNDELIWLEYYFNMEQRRLRYQFDFQIELNDATLNNFPIPPMILQPIVENCIVHGFNPSTFIGKGLVIINIEKINTDEILIKITDNGLGNKTKQVNTERGRPSISTDNINQRINLINEMKLFKINISQQINEEGSVFKIQISVNV